LKIGQYLTKLYGVQECAKFLGNPVVAVRQLRRKECENLTSVLELLTAQPLQKLPK